MTVSKAGGLAPWRGRLQGLEAAHGPVVVACSGGTDSLALLAVAVDAGLDPVAVHVDHALRPGSDLEAEHVAGAARQLGARVDARRIEHLPLGSNLEARARDARYELLERARVEHGAQVVLVGHTADDQAETVLLNLLRGSATAGLGGMPVRRGSITRPLLGLRRADTAEICVRLRLAPLHDPLNHELGFRRVWLRREVIPLLERGAGRDLSALLARQADVLRAESDFLDEIAAADWPGAEGPRARALARLAPPLARRAARVWLGGLPPSLDEVDAVLKVARGERRAVELSGGRRVWRRAGVLHVTRGSNRRHDAATYSSAAIVAAAARSIERGDVDAIVPLPGRTEAAGLVVESWIERDAPVEWPDGQWTCVVDAGAVGRRGRLRLEAGKVVLCDAGSGEPIWTVGYRVERRARVTPCTHQYLWIAAGAT